MILIPVNFRLTLSRAAIEHQLYFINILVPRWAFRQGGLMISDALVKYARKYKMTRTFADTKVKNAWHPCVDPTQKVHATIEDWLCLLKYLGLGTHTEPNSGESHYDPSLGVRAEPGDFKF